MQGLENSIALSPVVSVKDLVEQCFDPVDRWNLALVQRDRVWDELHTRHLLDSLIAGYPIGAILLCRVRDKSRVIVTGPDRARREEDAGSTDWQIIDGQQRINALTSLLTPRSEIGSILVDLTSPRPRATPGTRKRAKQRLLGYSVCVHDDQPQIEGRERYVDLSRWREWFWREWFPRDTQSDPIQITPDTVSDVLHQIDPLFTEPLSGVKATAATCSLQHLVDAWNKPCIPVLRVTLDSPEDVLEVFTRVNRGGVNVSGPDIYFAGVKTFWNNAEQTLDDFMAGMPIMNSRMHALRFVSRLSATGLGLDDTLPLRVEALSSERGTQLIRGLTTVTSKSSNVRTKVQRFAQWYVLNSKLGYVLKLCTNELWDDVLSWVATSDHSTEEWYKENLGPVDAYLLGATMFRYHTIFGDSFHKLALRESLLAGSRDDKFPLELILSVLDVQTRVSRRKRRRAYSLYDPDDKLELADQNGRILTSLAQEIGFNEKEDISFDWDHIFPQAQASRMTERNQSGRRIRHHLRRYIYRSGNIWPLESSMNRSIHDTPCMEKFDKIRDLLDKRPSSGVSAEERWSVSEQEIRDFRTVDQLLNGDRDSIDEAMELFRKTVDNRSLRLLDKTIADFPDVALFSADGPHEASDATEWDERVGQRLGLGSPTSAPVRGD